MEPDSPRYAMGGTRPPKRLESSSGTGLYFTPENITKYIQADTTEDTYPVRLDDVSYLQGFIDFDKMRLQAQAVYIRAGFGDAGIDANVKQNTTDARAAGMPFGLYWFVRVGDDWRQHIDNFWKKVQEYKPSLPPVFDCEYTSLIKSGSTAWMEKLYSNWMTTTKVQPIIYTRASWWDTNLARQDWPKECRLWIAHYTNAAQPILPDDWAEIANPKTWTFWQWSADGNGQGDLHGVSSDDIDRNRFQGSVAEFNQIFGTNIKALGEPIEPPPPPPEETPMQVKTRTTINIRNAPNLSISSIIGTSLKGAILDVVGDAGDFWITQTFVAKSVVDEVEPTPPVVITGWKVLHDWQTKQVQWRGLDKGVPEVFHFDQDAPTQLTHAWQHFIMALNPGMSADGWRSLAKWDRAFTNGTGYDNPNGNKYADYITPKDTDKKPPVEDKCRCCGGANLHGTVSNGILIIETLDGSKDPPALDWVLARPWLYFRCYTIKPDNTNGDFPQNGGKPVYWPLVANGKVTVKINTLIKEKPYPQVVPV